MRNFHLTRIAVNLLLIVALAIQPVAVCLGNVVGGVAGCSQAGAFTCQGCGCCQVDDADDRCCCCSGPVEEEVDQATESSCCSGSHIASEESESSPENVDDGGVTAIGPIETGVRTICLCNRAPQPLSDSSPRRATSDDRDSLSVGSTALDANVWDSGPLLATTHDRANLPVTLHFSQSMLCIWRL